MTTKQQQLRRHLNLTIEGDEELDAIYASGNADALREKWSDEYLREFVEAGTPGEDSNASYVAKAITLRDAVCAEMEAA